MRTTVLDYKFIFVAILHVENQLYYVGPSPPFQLICFDVCLALQFLISSFVPIFFKLKPNNKVYPVPSPSFPLTSFLLVPILVSLFFSQLYDACKKHLSSRYFLYIHHGGGVLHNSRRSYIRRLFALSRLSSWWVSCGTWNNSSGWVQMGKEPSRAAVHPLIKCEPSRRRLIVEHKISQVKAAVPGTVKITFIDFQNMKLNANIKIIVGHSEEAATAVDGRELFTKGEVETQTWNIHAKILSCAVKGYTCG